jgi:high-affinity Fe2+/Pb2+ permease
MTNFLLLVGAGLFTSSVAEFQAYAFGKLLGTNSDAAGGTGPGSSRVQGNVWHLDCCSSSAPGWLIFSAIFGWSNDASSKPTQLSDYFGTIVHHHLHSWYGIVVHLLLARRYRRPRLHEVQGGRFYYSYSLAEHND